VENDIVTRRKLGPAGKIDLGFLANRRLWYHEKRVKVLYV
jgi:hypothetical protein